MTGPIPSAGPHCGRVVSFDQARGLGDVREDDGTTYGFHATAIADGSRTIATDAAVTFTVAPAHRGRYEAHALESIGTG